MELVLEMTPTATLPPPIDWMINVLFSALLAMLEGICEFEVELKNNSNEEKMDTYTYKVCQCYSIDLFF